MFASLANIDRCNVFQLFPNEGNLSVFMQRLEEHLHEYELLQSTTILSDRTREPCKSCHTGSGWLWQYWISDHTTVIFLGSHLTQSINKKAIQSFQATNPNVIIHSTFSDWTSYWDKLNTQIAGGNTPDLIQMDLAYVAQYVKQNIILDLTPFIKDKTFDTSNFEPTLLKNSEYNGKLYGVPLGGNYAAFVYDTTFVQQSGAGTPPTLMSYQDFANYTKELTNALKSKGIYGTVDPSGQILNFEGWVRQRGKNLYTPDGKLGFDATDAAEWFDYWNGLRTSGACIPAQMQASVSGSSGADTSLMI